jgi:hypothetical protein
MLTYKKREEGMVTPFIRGYNVWDIPEAEWTHSVQQAIISAYELGVKHTTKHFTSNIEYTRVQVGIPFSTKWVEDEPSNNNN